MAYSTDERKNKLKVTAALRREVVRKAADYMARTGLTETDFARRLRTRGGSSYSRATFNHFMAGRYHVISGDDSLICQAVMDFLGSYPITPEATVVDRKLYETQNVRLIRQYFYEALDKGRAYLLRGAPGTQKSEAIEHLVAELNRTDISKNGKGRRAFTVYCRVRMTPTDLMKEIAIAAGSSSLGGVGRIMRNLRFDLSGRRVLFLFDESQHLSIDCLETVRELIDKPPFCGLLFLGSHEIEKIFSRLDMEQWGDRARKTIELPGLQESEAADIIESELGSYPREKVEGLIKKCYGTDLRKGRQTQYISARKLFFSIQTIQERQQQK